MYKLRILAALILLSGSIYGQVNNFNTQNKYVVIPDENDSVDVYFLEGNLAVTTTAPKAFDVDTTHIFDSLVNYKANLPLLPDTGWVGRNNLYTYNDKMLRIVQPHDRATVAHFDPETVPALYTFREPGCPEWEQPSGAQDAYDIGVCVTLNGVKYRSRINANTTNPEQFNDTDTVWQYWDKEPFD